ncbi:MAG: MiaB/RimO family radical SAM methylthiotransferase [Solirubrobacteraceae bacterium]
MATFAVKFLGCKVSQADAMLAREALLGAGHLEVADDEADLHVVNTCCITAEAEAKSRQSVRRSLRAARRVYASGCAVNLNAREFGDLGTGVIPFTGAAEQVADRIAAHAGAAATDRIQPSAAVCGDAGATACADTDHDVLARDRLTAAEPLARTRGFVKVQDGCDSECAYCIIPTVRGPARSRPASAVLREVRRRVDAGQPEMVMTGISVGDYRDPEQGMELGDLMREVARVPGVERVRLSSVEVIHVRDSLLRALADEPKVCPHLHVPLQSGDDAVLAAMGRHYTAAEYVEQIARVRCALPHLNVTADVIVGFPIEDEAAFERTLETVDAAGITRVHVFPYSPRPGTVAAGLSDAVGPAEKRRRGQALRAHSELRSREHRRARVGACERVLVDKVASTQCSGYTVDYVRAYLPAGAAARGELVDAHCEGLQADGIRCVPTRG